MKKIISIIIAASLALASLTCFGTAALADEGKIIVLCTSDIRGDIDRIARIGQLREQMLSEGNEVILVDSGDFLQGTRYAAADKGKSIVELMENVGYDVVNFGAYDFAFGNATMGARPHGTLKAFLTLTQLFDGGEADNAVKEASPIKALATTISGSNEYFSFDGNASASAVITTSSGKKIGFVGINNPATPDMVLEESLAGLSFDTASQITADVNAAANALEDDYTICLRNADITPSALDVDKVIGNDGNRFCVSQLVLNSDLSLASFGEISLDDAVSEPVPNAKCEEIRSAVDAAFPDFVKSEVILNGSAQAVRSEETNLGNLFADALRWYATEGGIENAFPEDYRENGYNSLTVPEENVVALWNGGNLRDYLYDGDIILQDVQRTLPYPNTVAIAYVTGAQLLEALEAARQYPSAFASVSGMTYNIDELVPLTLGEEYSGSAYKKPTSSGVTIKAVNSRAFSKTAKYAVITSNMIYNGGDTYGAFKGDAKQDDSVILSSVKVTDVVWRYMKEALSGVVGGEYSTTQGRITFSHTHSYSTTVSAQPSCTSAGESVHTCSLCGASYKTAIARLSHSYSTITLKAGVGKAGSITTKCTSCGNVKSSSAIPAVKSVSLSKSAYAYNGKEKKPSVTIKDSKGNRLSSSSYSVKYSANKNVGTATAIITLRGNYSGVIKKTFRINPPATKLNKPKALRRGFTASWKRKSTQVKGYQLCYATDKGFKKNKNTINIKNNSTTRKTVRNLKSGKKYFIRIRTYKIVNGEKYYSAWSDTVSVKALKG